ncbi:MAG: hypothetical protein HRT38_11775 [Alteromonadaceae bacterium]|nr:hypothetical protein [Alteromonadaceae bacterium]
MKLFNKTALAISFSICGVLSSVSALAMATDVKLNAKEHQIHQIKVSTFDDNANVFVNDNGDIREFIIAKDLLEDQEKLALELADISPVLKEKLITLLTGDIQIHGDQHVIVDFKGDVDSHFNLFSESVGESIVIIEKGTDHIG